MFNPRKATFPSVSATEGNEVSYMDRIFQPFVVRHQGLHLSCEPRDQRTGWSFHTSTVTVQYSTCIINMISTVPSYSY